MSRQLLPTALLTLVLLFAGLLIGCQPSEANRNGDVAQTEQPGASSDTRAQAGARPGGTELSTPDLESEGLARATFAGGCFWCMEPPFERLEGVVSVTSGYTDGPEEAPTYNEVSSGQTGHTEAVEILYNPDVVSYDELLTVFWRAHDPTDLGGQFADRGSQYRPGIYTHTELQREQAEASKAALEAEGPFDKPIVTPIKPAQPFWIAEAYHQDYYKTNPTPYQRYYQGSGRKGFLERTWSAD
ncbi:peptide-methionine (S)-S-oxide reductase [Lujinxingia sediminis]|uniref:Peptide methionine sulfoxide reductase MsrA n=1 Tax=Lujinxingia sediminis TaxID=2480984 RepID=A0ABY0CPJ7_9DELT|nr:peptide-methionine (S)-S-oxide reductase MsrA [Lujinxingia sediminis]RVU41606.1 peptide-methionine (S)-S-oxide reductase [Lujinxingia sediminis]